MERVRNRPAALVALKDERALGHLVASVRRCAGVCLRQTKAARAVRGPRGRMSRLRGAKVLAAARSENGSPRTARPRALQALAGHSEITAELSRGLMEGEPSSESSLPGVFRVFARKKRKGWDAQSTAAERLPSLDEPLSNRLWTTLASPSTRRRSIWKASSCVPSKCCSRG